MKKFIAAAFFCFIIFSSSQSVFAEVAPTDERFETLSRDLAKLQKILESRRAEQFVAHMYTDEHGIKRALVIVPLLERISDRQFFEASNKMKYGVRASRYAFYPSSYSVHLETNWEIGSKRTDLKLVVETRNDDPRQCSQFTITKYTGEEGRDDALYLRACDSLLQDQNEKRQIEKFVETFQLLLFETGK